MVDRAGLTALPAPDAELRRRRFAANSRFLDRLSHTTRCDYTCYIQLNRWGYLRSDADPARGELDLDAPDLVGGYCSSSLRGQWIDREFNSRRRVSGGRTYSPRRYRIPPEDIVTMVRHAGFAPSASPSPRQLSQDRESAACARFARAARPEKIEISLGVRELQLLADKPWERDEPIKLPYCNAFQRLINRGYVDYEPGRQAQLTAVGAAQRHVFVLSGIIVE